MHVFSAPDVQVQNSVDCLHSMANFAGPLAEDVRPETSSDESDMISSNTLQGCG